MANLLTVPLVVQRDATGTRLPNPQSGTPCGGRQRAAIGRPAAQGQRRDKLVQGALSLAACTVVEANLAPDIDQGQVGVVWRPGQRGYALGVVKRRWKLPLPPCAGWPK